MRQAYLNSQSIFKMKEFRLYQDLTDYEKEDENSFSVGNVLDLESYDSFNYTKLLESRCSLA